MFLPRTFNGGGYEVTVQADRSIRVRQGDWLSKYSMAIYGDFNHINSFKKKVGEQQFEKLKNPDLIRTGDILYHPDPLPQETPEGDPGEKREIRTDWVIEFLKWVNQSFLITDWRVVGNGGFDLGLSFGTIQYATIGVRNTTPMLDPERDREVVWFHALASGLTIGFPDDVFVSGSISTIQFPGIGHIMRAPWVPRLVRDDFRHGIFVVEAGVSMVAGAMLTFLFFGIGFPPTRIFEEAQKLFYYGDLGAFQRLLQKGMCSGVAICAGNNFSIPGMGVACRAGLMYDRGYWGL